MKKAFTIFTISIVILSILVVLFPTLFICDIERALSLGATILSGLAGVGAIVFGYKIYKDLGIDKVVTDKQVNTVIEFLEELKGIQIQVAAFEEGKLHSFSFWTIKKKSHIEDAYQKNDDYKWFLVVDPENYYSALKGLNKISNSVWMPTELKSAFEFISPPVLVAVSFESKYQNHVKAVINDRINLVDTTQKTWMKFDGKDVTIIDLYKNFQNCIFTIEKWLQTHSKIPIDLNF